MGLLVFVLKFTSILRNTSFHLAHIFENYYKDGVHLGGGLHLVIISIGDWFN